MANLRLERASKSYGAVNILHDIDLEIADGEFVVLIGPSRRREEVVSTLVSFAPLTSEEIDWYVASGEPMGKAGAYAIQGLGARFVHRIDGSWSNVVGLPLEELRNILIDLDLISPA